MVLNDSLFETVQLVFENAGFPMLSILCLLLKDWSWYWICSLRSRNCTGLTPVYLCTPHHRYSTLPYSIVQNKTVQYRTVQYSTVQYSTVQYSTVQYSTVQYSTVQYSTVQYSTVLYSTVQYGTEQYRTEQNSTVQYSTVQYSTVQCSVKCIKLSISNNRENWLSEQFKKYVSELSVHCVIRDPNFGQGKPKT
jgi:hypothetical protein